MGRVEDSKSNASSNVIEFPVTLRRFRTWNGSIGRHNKKELGEIEAEKKIGKLNDVLVEVEYARQPQRIIFFRIRAAIESIA